MYTRLKTIIIIPFVILTACVSVKPATEAPANEVIPQEEREAKTKTISTWELSGAIAAKNKTKNWTASINWAQQGPNNYNIRLSGPLSSGTVLINKKGSVVTYKEGSKNITSSNADELLQKQTGIRLPVDNLYYWVRGLPAPGGGETAKHDEYNHASQIKQNGYVIDYTKFTSVNGVDLPSVVRLSGHDMNIKLVVKHWKVS